MAENKKVVTVNVRTTAELEQEIVKWIDQGYSVKSQTPKMATLVWEPQANYLLMIVLFLLCIIPGILYQASIVRKMGSQVVIRVDRKAAG